MRERDHEGADRDVDQKRRPPRDRFDQVAADQRCDRGRHPGEPGPGADCPRAILVTKAGLDHRQAPGGEQRTTDPLHDPRRDQRLVARGDRAEQRGQREQPDPDDEDPAAPVAVAERAAEQDQGRKRQQIAVEDPLQPARRRVEVLADRRQRDVDDRPVEKRHPRAEDRDGEHPAAGGALVGEVLAQASLACADARGRRTRCADLAHRPEPKTRRLPVNACCWAQAVNRPPRGPAGAAPAGPPIEPRGLSIRPRSGWSLRSPRPGPGRAGRTGSSSRPRRS